MTKGLKTVGPHQCKYQYSDKTCCGNSTIHNYQDREKLEYCILHTRNDHKLLDMSRYLENMIKEKNKLIREEIKQRNLSEKDNYKEINEIREKNQIVLEGAYFPNESRLVSDPSKIHIESDITFYNAFFSGKFFPLNTVFKGKASFTGVKFEALTNFNNAVFHNDANFRWVSFKETALFINTVFKAKADFMETNFDCTTEFFKTIFEQDSIFLVAKFKKTVFFKYTAFLGKTDFARAKFSNEADFQHSVFKGETTFHDSTFRKRVSLLFTVFLKNTDFKNVIFEKNTDFRGSLFVNGASFQNAKFLSTLDFSFAEFLDGTLDFSYASFKSDDTLFTEVVFNSVVLFNNLLLKGVRFTGCYLGGCSFHNSDIKDAIFINCSWNENHLYRQLSVLISALSSIKERKWILDEIVAIKRFNPGYLPEQKYRKNILYDEICHTRKKMRENPSMSEIIARFLIKNSHYLLHSLLILTGILFFIISNKTKIMIGVIYLVFYLLLGLFFVIKKRVEKKKEDEYILKLAQPNEGIERLLEYRYLEGMYCQFKLNLDKNKSYAQANEFYFGEKLWERKKLFREKRGKPMWLFLWLYWALNGYGNRPLRTIANLLLLLALLSWVLLHFGLIHKSISIKENLSFISTLKTGSIQKKNISVSYIEENLNNVISVMLWNLTASPGSSVGEYSADNENDKTYAKVLIFFIQWVFRPFMIAMVIISVRRKVQRD